MRYTIITFLFLTLTTLVPSSEAFRCGTPHLKHDIVQQLPSDSTSAPTIPAAPTLSIGFQRPFFAIDFAKNQQYTINATLRASGTHCYIFVEDTVWQQNVNAHTVQTVQRAFDTATPAHPRRGIYDILSEDLGPPPDVDGNEKVILLILNIRDRNSSQGTAGYFMPVDQHRGVLHHTTLGPLHSNEADILYIDSKNYPTNADMAEAIIAHEFQHLINYKYSPKEEIWVDEGCAEYAAFHCGYDLYQHIQAFQKTPHISLTDWTQMGDTHLLSHYGAAFFFMLYLHDHYGGTQTLAALVQNPKDGIAGITDTVVAQGKPNTFANIFADWKVANYLSTWRLLGTIENTFQYHSLKPAIQPLFTHRAYPVNGRNKVLANFSAHAIEYKVATAGQAGLNLSYSTQRNTPIDIKVAYLQNTGDILVESVQLKTTDGTASLDIPTFGTTVQRVLLIPSLQVENRSFAQQSVTYNYNAYEGNLGTYTTHVLPNPIHPNYWEIIAVPTETVGIHSLTVTLTYQNRTLFDAEPMTHIQQEDRPIYRYVFHLKPEVEVESVEWVVKRGDTIIDEGDLKD